MSDPMPRPRPATEVLDRYFLENRARLLEIAAFLDRLDRCDDAQGLQDDCRYRAFLQAVARLQQAAGGRTRELQILFSDPTSEPLASAGGGSALGAYPGLRR